MAFDKFIQDFSAVWRGERDARPTQELHNKTVALERKEQKGASTITIPGYQGSMDENGAVTIIQTGSHYILVNSSDTAAFRAMVNALIPAPDQPVVDLNDETTAWQGPPRTNSQMSMEQNVQTVGDT